MTKGPSRMKSVLLALALMMIAAPPALAHKLKVFVQAEGATIVGTAYFAGGGKAMDSQGRAMAPDGTVIATFRTDGEGRFQVPVTVRQDYTVHVDTGDGHVAEATLHGRDLPESLPAGQMAAAGTTAAALDVTPLPNGGGAAGEVSPAALEAAVTRAIGPLREQIDMAEERARFSDIMGGIGTIFGIFGIAAWIAARRKPRT